MFLGGGFGAVEIFERIVRLAAGGKKKRVRESCGDEKGTGKGNWVLRHGKKKGGVTSPVRGEAQGVFEGGPRLLETKDRMSGVSE